MLCASGAVVPCVAVCIRCCYAMCCYGITFLFDKGKFIVFQIHPVSFPLFLSFLYLVIGKGELILFVIGFCYKGVGDSVIGLCY